MKPMAEYSAHDLRCLLVSSIKRRIADSDELIEQLAEAVVDALREIAGGRELYIPARNKEPRNEAIRSRFNGRNQSDLMREFGISSSTLYAIVRNKPR